MTPGFVRRSAGSLPWAIIATLGTLTIGTFIATIVKEAAKDVYALRIREFIERLFETRDRPEGNLEFVDGEGTRLIIPTQISKRALEALAEVDWPAKRGDYLTWDERRDEWRDPMREQRDAT